MVSGTEGAEMRDGLSQRIDAEELPEISGRSVDVGTILGAVGGVGAANALGATCRCTCQRSGMKLNHSLVYVEHKAKKPALAGYGCWLKGSEAHAMHRRQRRYVR